MNILIGDYFKNYWKIHHKIQMFELNSKSGLERQIKSLNEFIKDTINLSKKTFVLSKHKINLPKDLQDDIKRKKKLQRTYSKTHDPIIKI